VHPLANQQRLENTVKPDRVGQLGKRFGLEPASWLLRIRPDVGDRDLHREPPAGAVVDAEFLDVLA